MTIENRMDWPAPKYMFGDRVQFRYRDDPYQGMIIGMTYLSPVMALKGNTQRQGWEYKVSLIDGLPLEKVVAFEGQRVYEVLESDEDLTGVMTSDEGLHRNSMSNATASV